MGAIHRRRKNGLLFLAVMILVVLAALSINAMLNSSPLLVSVDSRIYPGAPPVEENQKCLGDLKIRVRIWSDGLAYLYPLTRDTLVYTGHLSNIDRFKMLLLLISDVDFWISGEGAGNPSGTFTIIRVSWLGLSREKLFPFPSAPLDNQLILELAPKLEEVEPSAAGDLDPRLAPLVSQVMDCEWRLYGEDDR